MRQFGTHEVWRGAPLVAAICLVLAVAGPVPAAAAEAASLTVRVQGVTVRGGVLRLGLYNRAHYPDDDAVSVAAADVPAVPGETVVTLTDIPPGTYALVMFQDINANGEMDKSWVGLPLEPYGFSRNATPFLSKPTFDAVKFALAPGANAQVVDLQNTVAAFARN